MATAADAVAPGIAVGPGIIWPKDRTVITDDRARICYTIVEPDGTPTGRTVALLAGFLSPDTWWDRLVPTLTAAGHRVLLWHYRGIGGSTLPEDGSAALTVPLMAEDLRAVLDDAGIHQVDLLGHSIGVQVTLEAYRVLRSRVGRIALITGAADSPIRSLYGRGAVAAALYAPLAAGARMLIPPVRRLVWRTAWTRLPMWQLGQLVRAYGPRTDGRLIDGYLAHAADLDPAYVLDLAAAVHTHSALDLLPEIAVPTLIVAGGADPITPVGQSELMAGSVRSSTLRVVPHGTHGTLLEYPETVHGWILDLLDA